MDFFGILYDIKNGKKVPYSKTYFDTLFAAKLAEMQIKTLTGTLPLTFRTSETALRSWTIYGNNNAHSYSAEGTLPLTFASHTAGAASDWEIEGNNNIGKNLLEITATSTTINGVTFTVDKTAGTITANGTAQSVAQLNLRIGAPSGNYYFSGCASGGSSSTYYIIAWDNSVSGRAKQWDGVTNSLNDYGAESNEIKVDSGHSMQLTITIMSGYTANNLVFKPMLRAADTSPEFEPYQIGVGQRTKNKLKITATTQEINGVTFTVDKEAGTITANGTATAQVLLKLGEIINATDDPINYYLSGGADGGSEQKYFIIGGTTYLARLKKWDGVTDMSGSVSSTSVQQMQIPANSTGLILLYIRNGVSANNCVFKPMVRLSDTSADFIPYGYEIPLTVNNTPQTFYIGSTPLTAGQSISKTSTGVDIAAIAGSNTITTDLYNKPEMAIEGVDYVGVGEPVNDSWQIPLTVTHYTDNIFDKDAKNANKGYEDSTCIMWAGSIPYPYMTGNIPEDNNCFVSEKIPASPNTTYYLTDGIFKNTDNGIYSVFLWNRFRMSDYQAFPTEKTFITGDDTKFIQLCVLKSYADTVMITTKPTETYIPHVEVNNVNVPIDAPLTAGQSVSDTQTIEVFEGENTIDTTLYNKPTMEIKYK